MDLPSTVRQRLVLAALALGCGLSLLEAATFALFRWPAAWRGQVPSRLERLLMRYHEGFLMAAPIQFRPECSEPDAELLYRLRPGRCRFAGDEFDTTVRISRRHLREDEMVADPDLVVLGDSVALGWGVEREEAFPALLAARLGARAVVVANSSYGTVRELLLLRRLGLRDFRQAVLQYHANDLRENRAFLDAGVHRASPPGAFTHWVAVTARIHGKVVLPRTRHWFSLLWSDLVGAAPPADGVAGPAEHAAALLAVLGSFAPDLRQRPLLIFAVGLGDGEPAFVAAVNAAASAPQSPPRTVSGLGQVRAVGVETRLRRADFFALDPHWRSSGHRAVAAALAAELDVLHAPALPQ